MTGEGVWGRGRHLSPLPRQSCRNLPGVLFALKELHGVIHCPLILCDLMSFEESELFPKSFPSFKMRTLAALRDFKAPNIWRITSHRLWDGEHVTRK